MIDPKCLLFISPLLCFSMPIYFKCPKDCFCTPANVTETKTCSNASVRSYFYECPANCVCSPKPLKAKYIVCNHYLSKADLDNLAANLRTNDVSQLAFLALIKTELFPQSICSLNISRLSIEYNEIKALLYQKGCLRRLEYFKAIDNEIRQIDSMFFKDMNKLLSVNLKRNLLTSLDPNTFIWPSLAHLQEVDLSENKLKVIDLWPMKMQNFIRMGEQESSVVVNVSFNQIEKIVNTVDFKITRVNTKNYILFDLSHNKLHSLQGLLTDLLDNPLAMNVNRQLTYILDSNEFYCYCDMLRARKLIRYFQKSFSPRRIDMKCFKPDRLQNFEIYAVQDEDFQCYVDNCTYTAECQCVKTRANKTLRVECVQGGLDSLPMISSTAATGITYYELYVTNSYLNSLDLRPFDGKLSVLDISSNNISSLPTDFPIYLNQTKYILLRNNKLKTLPGSVKSMDFKDVEDITLSGNPFTCDCTSLWLKEWIKKHRDKISDIIEVHCAFPDWNNGKLIEEVDDSDFVCSKVPVGKAVGFPLGFLIILFCIAAMILYFRDYIKLFLFSRLGWRFTYGYADEERAYDVFVSYSRHDEEWVEQTLSNTLEEHDPPFRVCLHYKDFEPGIPIAENISHAVEESHCTVIAVSGHFLQSEWCRYEFRLAHNDAVNKRSTKVIVILLEPVVNLELDRDLNMYIKTNTYLERDDPRFWKKLLMALPKPSGRVRDFLELEPE